MGESDLSIIKVTGFQSKYKLDINIPIPDDYEFLNNVTHPNYKGVYIIYDYFGTCLYVGLTIQTIKERIKQHIDKKHGKLDDFIDFAYYLKTYNIKDGYDILILEKLLIKALKPIFSRESPVYNRPRMFSYEKSKNQYIQNIDTCIAYQHEIKKTIEGYEDIIVELENHLEGSNPYINPLRNILKELRPDTHIQEIWADFEIHRYGEAKKHSYPPHPTL